jgi:hypothetical protein
MTPLAGPPHAADTLLGVLSEPAALLAGGEPVGALLGLDPLLGLFGRPVLVVFGPINHGRDSCTWFTADELVVSR